MLPQSHAFKSGARIALGNQPLQKALGFMKTTGFPAKRLAAVQRLPEFEALREEGRTIKDRTLKHLDFYLETFEANVIATGGHVHWCRTAAEACETILKICRALDAKTVTKGKSMVAEEIALNEYLEKHGITPVETDLGEYIIQLRHEPPSHIIAPAIHLVKEQVAETFRAAHTDRDPDRPLNDGRILCDEARAELRQKFLAADVGITGANFLIAETGSSIIVTNEGNGDLTQTLTKAHIVVASLEKVVPTLEDLSTLNRVLPRSATGQEISNYFSILTGPKAPQDADGPAHMYVILVDAGRTGLLGGEMESMLSCIRCGACMNHCPVYRTVGGHAYGWVYPGPMGSVLTPAYVGLENALDLPQAATLCGACEAVCPVRIPLPELLRGLREKQTERGLRPWTERAGLGLWAWAARRPAVYALLSKIGVRLLRTMGGARGRIGRLPLGAGWTLMRDMPAPEGRTFRELYAARPQGTRLS